MATAWEFARAFEQNCPGVRLTKEERAELARLFLLARSDARENQKEPQC